jgi:ATP synthase protein I
MQGACYNFQAWQGGFLMPRAGGATLDSRNASPATVLAFAQIATTAIAVVATAVKAGRGAAMAALFGGLVVVLPTLYFAVRMRLRRDVMDAKQALGELYRAELGKLLLTGLMFIVGALIFGKHYAALMLTCVACLAMNWVVLAFARPE